MAEKPVAARRVPVHDRRVKWNNPSGTKTYYAWRGMRLRCANPKNQAWANYGGRGIRVFQRWADDYDAFFEDMGPCPEGMSLDRIDNDGDYEPGNCRWVGWDVQSRNKRTTRLISHGGQTKPLADWAADLGVSVDTLHRRLGVYQMPVDKALTPGSLVPQTRCGTRNGYERGCRCNACKAAHAARHREMRAKRKSRRAGGELATEAAA